MRNKSLGQSLVELILTIGLAAIILPALATGLITSREGKAQQQQRLQAISLLKETQEAVRNIRNRDWSNLVPTGTYHPEISGTEWILAPSPTVVGDFTQSVKISDVNRNPTGVLVPTPTGSPDPSTKRVDITITWNKPYFSSIDSSLYFTRWRDNLSYVETTQTQFNGGMTNPDSSGVTVRGSAPLPFPTPTVQDDGEIMLASGGYGNWCDPSLESNTLNLPGNASESIIMASSGNAYIGTGANASGDPLDYVVISNPQHPASPIPSLAGSFTGNQFKSYGIFGDGTYAYLTTDHPNTTLEIIRLADFTLVGIGDAGSDGKSVFVTNNLAFVTTGNSKLNVFDISTPANPTLLKSTSLTGGYGNKVIVAGSDAYVAVNATSNQLQIVPWSYTGGTFTFGTSVNISIDGLAAQDLTISSDQKRVYIITSVSSDKSEFFIIDTDTASPTYKQTKGSYDTKNYGEMDPKGIAVVPGNIAMIGGSGNPVGNQVYQVLNIGTENNIINCKSLSTGFNMRGMAAVKETDGDAYTYALAAADPEFRIIVGGPGGGYASTGTFESQTFNSTYQTADNRFVVNIDQPGGTSIAFQVALANIISGNCPTSYTFLGPSGTSADWFTPPADTTTYSAPFPLGSYAPNYSNPGQCFRYKVKLDSTNGTTTPVLYDFTINYSP